MTTSIASVAAAQRVENARRITATLAALTALSVPAVLLIDASPAILWLLVGTTGGLGGAYALARAGRPAAGITVAACTIWLEQVAVVVILRELGPIPYLAPLIVLVVAATARDRDRCGTSSSWTTSVPSSKPPDACCGRAATR